MFDDRGLSERVGEWESSVSWDSPRRPWRRSTSEPPPPRNSGTGRAGVWWRGRAGPSDGPIVLPQPGLQEFVGQVVSSDDPNDLGQGGKDPRHLQSPPAGAGTGVDTAGPVRHRQQGRQRPSLQSVGTDVPSWSHHVLQGSRFQTTRRSTGN